jgi:hypothetical protein
MPSEHERIAPAQTQEGIKLLCSPASNSFCATLTKHPNRLESIRMTEEMKPSLIPTDVTLPDESGIDMIRKIGTAEARERWQDFALRAANESDPDKVLQLIEHINRLLEAEYAPNTFKRMPPARASDA